MKKLKLGEGKVVDDIQRITAQNSNLINMVKEVVHKPKLIGNPHEIVPFPSSYNV